MESAGETARQNEAPKANLGDLFARRSMVRISMPLAASIDRRGAGASSACPASTVLEDGVCFAACPNGFEGKGSLCWEMCPATHPFGCAGGCGTRLGCEIASDPVREPVPSDAPELVRP